MSKPHDALFKATFSQLEHARAELMAVLPRALVERIDWASLTQVAGTFTDKELAQSECDLLFTALIAGSEACIHLLFEHQSTVDMLMPLRLLRYMTRIWDHYLTDNQGARLPLVIPVVLHHSDAGWTGPTHFRELFDVARDASASQLHSAVAPYIPDFTFVLDDLSKVDDEALRSRALTGLAQLTLLVLQRMRGEVDPVAILTPWMETMVAVLTASHGSEAIQALLSYIIGASDGHPKEIRAFFQRLGPPSEEAFVSTFDRMMAEERPRILEQGRNEGRVEGRLQGRVEGKAELLLKLLSLRFGPVAAQAQSRVAQASAQELELWTDRVLTAATLDEVLGD
jgi:predicted transposase/invertase (TIGR01784 family)